MMTSPNASSFTARKRDHDLSAMLMNTPLPTLMEQAQLLRDNGHGDTLSYSRKVFIPLTQLCLSLIHI